MRIMVFDVPAESGGALSVLHDFYSEYKKDHENEYCFVISTPELEDANNIQVIRFPWIKKSWFHRTYFELFKANTLVKEYKVEKIISLQNTRIRNKSVEQILFVHNALPFSDYKFSLFSETFLWVYKNIVGRIILNSIKNVNQVVVQTRWMKETCIKKTGVSGDKIVIKPPNVRNVSKYRFNNSQKSVSTFFYPSNAAVFKNHNVILEACIELKKAKFNDYRVIFTLNGDENKNIRTIKKTVDELSLPIEFRGKMRKEDVFEMYQNSILIFPSNIETVGLPLIEAKSIGTPIIVNKKAYSLEILEGYNNVTFIEKINGLNLSKAIINIASQYYI